MPPSLELCFRACIRDVNMSVVLATVGIIDTAIKMGSGFQQEFKMAEETRVFFGFCV